MRQVYDGVHHGHVIEIWVNNDSEAQVQSNIPELSGRTYGEYDGDIQRYVHLAAEFIEGYEAGVAA